MCVTGTTFTDISGSGGNASVVAASATCAICCHVYHFCGPGTRVTDGCNGACLHSALEKMQLQVLALKRPFSFGVPCVKALPSRLVERGR